WPSLAQGRSRQSGGSCGIGLSARLKPCPSERLLAGMVEAGISPDAWRGWSRPFRPAFKHPTDLSSRPEREGARRGGRTERAAEGSWRWPSAERKRRAPSDLVL